MAAEAVVSVVVEQITSLLIAQAREEIDLLTGLQGKVENLLETVKDIQAVLDDAEQRQIKDKAVKRWLKKLEDVSYDIDDVLDQWGYIILQQKIEGNNRNTDDDIVSSQKQRVCSFTPSSCFCFKQVVVRRDIAIQIKEITEKLSLIDKQKNQFSFIIVSTSSNESSSSKGEEEWKPVKTSSFVDESQVYGRDSYKDDLVNHLLLSKVGNNNEKFQVVAIVGAGGIGKTTLAQLVYNYEQVEAHFEERVWVCVSNPFDVITVANAIVESLTLNPSNLKELDPLVQKIKNTLSGKRFLIVFDDVWTENPDKWVPFHNIMRSGNSGSTILLTTRSEDVAMAANAAHTIHVDVLSDSDSWSLFSQVAFSGRVDNEMRFKNIGEGIVTKCKGLPLAIKAIGSLLRSKKSIEEWKNIRDSNIWEWKVAEVTLFPQLYLSYKDLSPLLRRCFSYCAVFPKDTVIKIDDLIRLWIAQGYLNGASRGESVMEVKGREYFDRLAARSLFQDFTEDDTMETVISCKMHDIVHDFAQFVRQGECLMIEREQEEVKNPRHIKREQEEVKNPRHVTWIGGAEVIDTNCVKCNTSQCRSFFAKNLQLKAPTSIDLLNSLKRVKVLKLTNCGLEELPKEIGTLIRLRYLGLKLNKRLKELPTTIYNLYNLQTLDLEYCFKVRELLPGIEKLTKLRHLIVSGITLPEGISYLTCLQTLSIFCIGNEEYKNNKLGYLENLNQLRGSITIRILGNLSDSREVHNADLKSKKYIKVLRFEFIDDATITVEAMEAMEPPPTLHALSLECYRQSNLPVWITSLTNLVSLELKRCNGITSLDTVGMLPCLKTLKIERFDELKSIGPSFWRVTSSVAEATTIFPKLTKLIFQNCRQLEYWEDISGSSSSSSSMMMPRLRFLVIYRCNELKGLPYGFLREKVSLECIEFNRMKLNPTKFLSVVEAFSSAAQLQVEEDYDHHNNKVSPHQDKVTRTRSSILSELVHSKDYDELHAVMRLQCNGEQVVHLLMDNLSSSAIKPILDIIRKIAKCYHYSRVKSLVDSGIFPCLLRLWTNNQDSYIKDTICYLINDIIPGKDNNHIQDVIDAGFVVPLINHCKLVKPDQGRRINAAAIPISYMIRRGTAEQIKFMVTQQDLLRSFFRAGSQNTFISSMEKILQVGETIGEKGVNNNPFKQLIQEAGGLEILLQHKSQDSEWYHKRARKTVERYWPEVVEKEL